ncbi:unnamed protein product [Closterium sp. NIES-53]
MYIRQRPRLYSDTRGLRKQKRIHGFLTEASELKQCLRSPRPPKTLCAHSCSSPHPRIASRVPFTNPQLSLAFSNALPSPHKPSAPFFFSPPLPPHHILPFPPPPFPLPLSPPLHPTPLSPADAFVRFRAALLSSCAHPTSHLPQPSPSQRLPVALRAEAVTHPPRLRPSAPSLRPPRANVYADPPAHPPILASRARFPRSAAVARLWRIEQTGEGAEGGLGLGFYSSDQGPSNPENRAAEFAAAAAAAAAAGGVAAAAGSGALPGSTSSSSSSTSTSSSATSSDSSSSSSSSGSSGGSSGGAGLYRVPVSGGVQSATAAHGLPSPAVAVRNLVEQARFAHLCSIMSRMHHRRKGYPFGSLVDFATDDEGHPIFLLSPLSIHTRNMLADPRCTLVVQIPGWSGLANARATIFGDVYPVPPAQQQWAQRFFARRHHHGAAQMWGNFSYYRMQQICDIYFVGGFGTVAWIDVKDYLAATPDAIVLHDTEAILHELNVRLGSDLKCQLASILPQPVDDALFISIDGKGVDIRVRHGAKVWKRQGVKVLLLSCVLRAAMSVSTCIDGKGVDIRVRHGAKMWSNAPQGTDASITHLPSPLQFNVQRLSFSASSEVRSTDEAVAALHEVLQHGVTPLSNGMLQ